VIGEVPEVSVLTLTGLVDEDITPVPSVLAVLNVAVLAVVLTAVLGSTFITGAPSDCTKI